LVFKPDLIKLSQTLEGVIEYSPEGLILTSDDLTSEEAIVLSLLGVYVGNKLGLSAEESVSVTQIATASGKASKTILNQLKSMIDDGLVERVGRGKYKIRSLGIKRAENVLQDVKMRGRR
jgi:DNA-binding MarR family transcriptional regulator